MSKDGQKCTFSFNALCSAVTEAPIKIFYNTYPLQNRILKGVCFMKYFDLSLCYGATESVKNSNCTFAHHWL